MLQLLEGVTKHPEDVKEIFLHVQTSNTDAVRFYNRLGFEVTQTLQNYYVGIDPPHCKS
jgi:ribosomal protein S18 acetylase RimI-like enzyme